MRKAFFYILLLIISGCIETFEPDFDLDTSIIVITGIITDLQPAQIEITKPSARNAKLRNVQRVSGATVILYDDQGNQEQLYEKKAGYYEGISNGIVGRKYHINVQLSDNDIITSPPQLLSPSPSIDNLSLEQITGSKLFGKIKVELNGLDLNLDMNNSDTLARYYKWTIGGTYKRYSALDFNHLGPACYVTLPNHFYFALGESVSNSANLLSKNLKFINPDGTYAEGHSVEVSQYALTKEAYDYWEKIEDQQSNVGSVFDPPPAQIVGNLTYIDDQIPVLGFFEVSSVKKKRVFVRPTDFSELTKASPQFSTSDINSQCFAPFGWVGDWIPPVWCEDCSLITGSTHTKPSYWPE